VREGQPIFELPDPQRLRVKARINETKVGRLYEGIPAIIKIDAFPERPLRGKVAEVTAISTPVNGPFSDVRVYYATVNLEQGFSELRPGLTAEVMFRTNSRRDVARLPVSAVRTLDGRAFVAVPESPTSAPGRGPGSWRWQPVKVGLSDPDFVEIVAGVRRGDRVAADPYSLNPPAVLPALEPEADAPELAAVTR
jgi:HlyD family secretion protein